MIRFNMTTSSQVALIVIRATMMTIVKVDEPYARLLDL